jgi:hypothetical protein
LLNVDALPIENVGLVAIVDPATAAIEVPAAIDEVDRTALVVHGRVRIHVVGHVPRFYIGRLCIGVTTRRSESDCTGGEEVSHALESASDVPRAASAITGLYRNHIASCRSAFSGSHRG